MRADKFLELVDRYTDFSELTKPMLNEFMEKIVVYGRGKKRKRKTTESGSLFQLRFE